MIPKEPKRVSDINKLQPYLVSRVLRVLDRMKKRGYDPVVFETKRSYARQLWLYGYGRLFSRGKPYKTWTLNSLHLKGKAVDIISKSRGWGWDDFYTALHEEAAKERLYPLTKEDCHLEWRG